MLKTLFSIAGISLCSLLSFADSPVGTTTAPGEDIVKSGSWCDGTLTLTANFGKSNGTWTWSKDGVVINGETSNTLNVSAYGTGVYTAAYRKNDKLLIMDQFDLATVDGPAAKFDHSLFFAAAAVRFYDQTTSATPVVKWSWDFGDGKTSDQQNPEHFYSTEGTYTVKLTTTDSNGCSNTTSAVVNWQYPK